MKELTEERKYEYWNHFVSWVFFNKLKWFTPRRMEKVVFSIWKSREFWEKALLRYGGEYQTPEQMKRTNRRNYFDMMQDMEALVKEKCEQLFLPR